MKRIDHWTVPDRIIDAHVHAGMFHKAENLDFWMDQIQRHNLDKLAILCGNIEDLKILSQHPDQFIPVLWSLPASDMARAITYFEKVMELRLIRAIKLYPCQGFDPNDERLHVIYKTAMEKKLPITFHMGISSSRSAKMRYMNPELLIPILEEYPSLKVLFAHFAPVYFQELVRILHNFKQTYAETSSSNNWMKLSVPPLTLEKVFAKTIEIAGTGRIIFGTDSMDKQRGWRSGIYQTQLAVCNALELDQKEINQIFYHNYEDLLLFAGKTYQEVAAKMVRKIDEEELPKD